MTIIHLRDSPFVGGPEKQILGQCARLDRSRYEPMVVSFTRTGSNSLLQAASQLGIRTGSIPDGKLAFFDAVSQLRAILREGGECVVIASGFKADFTSWLACGRDSVPWVAWFHGHTAISARVRTYEAVDMLAVRRARDVVAVCESAAQMLRKCGLRKVIAVTNAVEF